MALRADNYDQEFQETFFSLGSSAIAHKLLALTFRYMVLRRIHHIAIICSDYKLSKHFYTEVLGLQVLTENFRADRNSYKLDLLLPDGGQIELFSFPNAPPRPSYPEAQGLRHLAFAVEDILQWKKKLESMNIPVEEVKIDEYTDRRFVFFADPDGLPLELYEEAACY
jgi:glyoxylase I family protein